jgi:outer membrane protein
MQSTQPGILTLALQRPGTQLAGREKRWQGVAGLLARGQIDGNYAKQDPPDATYASTVRRHGYSANITQPILDLSRIADFKRGNALAAQAEAEFSKAQQELITQVSNAYFDAHRLETIRRADRVIMLDRRKTIEVSPDQVWTAT